MLYATVSGGGYINPYFAIWNALRNDGAKRDILMAAAKANLNLELERDKNTFEEVKWVLREIKKINDDRNTVAHAPLTSTRTTNHVFPTGWTGDRFARRLEGYDVLSEYRRLRDTAIQLRDYVGRLAQAFSRERPAWPARSDLPIRPKAALLHWRIFHK